MTDTIVQEVRDARAAIAAEFDYDLGKYLAWIREQTQARKKPQGKAKTGKTLETSGGTQLVPVFQKRRVRPARVSG